MMTDGSFVATSELNVVGGALIRYASEPPRVPVVLGANFVLLLAESFAAGGWPQDNMKSANTTRTRTRRSDVKLDIKSKGLRYKLSQDAYEARNTVSLRVSILQINTIATSFS